MIEAGKTSDTVEKLEWITNIDHTMEAVLRGHIERIDEIVMAADDIDKEMRKVNIHFEMAHWVVGEGCRVLRYISSGYAQWSMVFSAFKEMSAPIHYDDGEMSMPWFDELWTDKLGTWGD